MEENKNMSKVVEEIKGASEEELKKVIEQHFEAVRTQGMKIGAAYISYGIEGAIAKHLTKGKQSSLRDYQRCIDAILKITSVQTRQNDSKTETNDEVMEETTDDGTAE